MTRITATAARERLPEILNRVAYGKERVCLTRHGRDVACVVSMQEARLLEALEEQMDLAEALVALDEAATEGTVPWDEVKKRLGL